MENQSEQLVSDALPYEVYEIMAKAVIGGAVRMVSYIGISRAGNIHQMVANHLAPEPMINIALWHCLRAKPEYSVHPRGEASSGKAAADLVRSLIAARPLVLNEYGTAWASNSVYRQYLTEYDLNPEDQKILFQRCLACGDTKQLSEFHVIRNRPRTDCRECINEQMDTDLTLAEYRQFRLNGWALPFRRPNRGTNR